MAGEQGHWITYQGRKIFISDDPIEKQYREIREQENSYVYPKNDMFSATYTTEPDTYHNQEGVSKKAMAEIRKTIDSILSSAKKENIDDPDALYEYIWGALHDTYALSSPYDEGSKLMDNNGGKYDKDFLMPFVSIDIFPTQAGVQVKLVGSSSYMEEFDKEDLEQMGIEV